MNRFRLSACIAAVLIALLAAEPAFAKSKLLDAATVHARIAKRGVNAWLCVEQSNGVQLVGRVIDIHPDTFTLQLPNDPEPVTIPYASVTELQTNAPRGFWIFTGSAIAVTVGFGIWAAVHFHHEEQQHQLPPLPTFPY
jgi:hypothetical protein